MSETSGEDQEHWLAKPLEAQELEIDGIRTFWVPSEGLTSASINFRVGMVDEPLVHAGVTHLIEHLAAYKALGRPHDLNAFVSPNFTSFVMRGRGSEVRRFFDLVSHELNNLPLERMEDELGLIATEASHRGSGALADRFRFGITGLGKQGLPEFGISSLSPTDVIAWRDRYFTRENATIAISGPMPKDLHFALPGGRHHPIPEPTRLGRSFPAWVPITADNLMMISLEAPPSTHLSVAASLGSTRGMQQLRMEKALSYGVNFRNEFEGSPTGELFGVADALPHRRQELLTGFMALMDDLATRPPTSIEIGNYIDSVKGQYFDPAMTSPHATKAAQRALLGTALRPWTEVGASLDDLDFDEVPNVVQDAGSRALVLTPLELGEFATSMFHLQPADVWSMPPVQGKPVSFRHHSPRQLLTLSPEGVTQIVDGKRQTVRFADCVLFQSTEQQLHLIDRSAEEVVINLNDLQFPDQFRRQLNSAIPQEVHLRTGSQVRPL